MADDLTDTAREPAPWESVPRERVPPEPVPRPDDHLRVTTA